MDNPKKKKSVLSKVVRFLLRILFLLSLILAFGLTWAMRNFGNVTLEQVVFLISVPMDGVSTELVMDFLKTALIPSFSIFFVTMLLVIFPRKKALVLAVGKLEDEEKEEGDKVEREDVKREAEEKAEREEAKREEVEREEKEEKTEEFGAGLQGEKTKLSEASPDIEKEEAIANNEELVPGDSSEETKDEEKTRVIKGTKKEKVAAEKHTGARKYQIFPLRVSNGFLAFVVLCSLLYTALRADEAFSVSEYIATALQTSTLIEEEYVHPDDVKITFPEKKKNLICIYI